MLSFEELYLVYSPDIYRFAYWLSGDQGDAEDITADTFVRAWMNINIIRTETLKAYLFTIARNIYLASIRKHRDHYQLSESQSTVQHGMERVIEDQNELDYVRQFLQTLPEVDRSAFALRIQHDLPYVEIARILQLSETAVKVKVHRIRKRLFSDFQERNSHE